jgi:hypothetical protein
LTLNITSDSKSSNVKCGSSGRWLGGSSPKAASRVAPGHSPPTGPAPYEHDYFASQPQKNTIHAYQPYWQQ